MGERKQIVTVISISILLLFGGLFWLALYPLDNYPYLSAHSYSADMDTDLTLHELFLGSSAFHVGKLSLNLLT